MRLTRREALAAIALSTCGNPARSVRPVPRPQWTDWNDVADSLARMEWDSQSELRATVPHTQGDVDWDGKGIRIRFGTGTVEDVDADLAEALATLGDRVLGSKIVRRHQAWAACYEIGGAEC